MGRSGAFVVFKAIHSHCVCSCREAIRRHLAGLLVPTAQRDEHSVFGRLFVSLLSANSAASRLVSPSSLLPSLDAPLTAACVQGAQKANRRSLASLIVGGRRR